MELKWGGIVAAGLAVVLASAMPAHAQTIEYGKRPTPNVTVTNPVKDITEFQFSLKYSGPVNLSLYDVAGRMVAELVDGPMAAGSHTVRWNRAGATGRGLYFARLRTAQGDRTLKVLVMGQ